MILFLGSYEGIFYRENNKKVSELWGHLSSATGVTLNIDTPIESYMDTGLSQHALCANCTLLEKENLVLSPGLIM